MDKLFRVFAILLSLTLPVLSFGQHKDNALASADVGKVIIMVVPFSPQMIDANGNQFICAKSDISAGKFSDIVRTSFTLSLMENLNEYWDVVEPKDNLADQNSDISVLYQIIHYKTLYKRLKSYYKDYPNFSLWQKIGPAYLRWGSDCVNDQKQKPTVSHHKYDKAEIIKGKDSIYSSIMNFHDASFTLIITDFEMTTRFKTCLDLQDNVFQRDFYVHYTLLNFDGKYITGGVVGTTYQSSTNDIKKIIDHNFSTLSGMIVANIRNKIPTQ